MKISNPLRRLRLDKHTRRVVVAAVILLCLVGAAAGLGGAAIDRAQASAPANTSPPAVSGTAQPGGALSATTGTWTGDVPISFSFQWQRCAATGGVCGDIAGAIAQTYTVTAADTGGTLRIVVTATNAAGSGSAASAPVSVAQPGSAPSPTAQPNPHGTAQVGRTLTADNGSWAGSTPIAFAYQWERCVVRGPCAAIAGAIHASYTVAAVDVGSQLRATITASNAFGSAKVPSNLTAVVVSGAGAPRNTGQPTVSAPSGYQVGAVLSGVIGSWQGTQPIGFSYGWTRCDAAGGHCRAIPGATGSTYTVTAGDVGSRLQFLVTASNSGGMTSAASALTSAATAQPAGAMRLPDGKTSIPASSVSLPNRLVISEVAFSPSVIRSQSTFTARFRVTDTRGYAVRDALVYAIGLPYGRIATAAEVPTGADGYVVMHLTPTAKLPLQRGGALVFFVRARKSGGDLLAGVSTRRLVQVTLGPAG